MLTARSNTALFQFLAAIALPLKVIEAGKFFSEHDSIKISSKRQAGAGSGGGYLIFAEFASESEEKIVQYTLHSIKGLEPNCAKGSGCHFAILDALSCDNVNATTERLHVAEYMTDSNGETQGVINPLLSSKVSLTETVGLPHAIFSSDGTLVSCSISHEAECTPVKEDCESDFYFYSHRWENGLVGLSSWENSMDLNVVHDFAGGLLESGCKGCDIAVMDASTCDEVFNETASLFKVQYDANDSGVGFDQDTIQTGSKMDDYANKPVVIFGSDGSIIDCGILTESQCNAVGTCSASETSAETISEAPGKESTAKDSPSSARLVKMKYWMLLGSAAMAAQDIL